MNFPISKPGCAGRRLGVTLMLVGLACALEAQTPASRTNSVPKPAEERFLLIVDTSVAMKKRAANVERVVGNLFVSGVEGQLHRGDTIGVWTCTDDLHTGQFPLVRWSPQTSAAIAKNIVDFLHSRKYEKTSRLAPVMAQLKSVVADSDRITVLFISNGEHALTGTPFDAPIAEAYQTHAAEQRKQQMPILTALRAVKGKYIGFTVNTPPWPVEFPKFPTEPSPAATKANPELLPQLKPEVKPAPKLEPPPETKLEPKPEPKLEVKPQLQIEAPPVLTATNSPPVSNALAAVKTPAPEIIPPVIPVIAPASPPPAATLVISNLPEQSVSPQSNGVVHQGGVVASTKAEPLPRTFLVGGSVLLIGIGVGGAVWLLRARSKPRASLITRSIDRDPT